MENKTNVSGEDTICSGVNNLTLSTEQRESFDWSSVSEQRKSFDWNVVKGMNPHTIMYII
jgi:hypothetical protein